MHDDLLQPTLADRTAAPDAARPWRLMPQFYVAAIGGVFAVTAIALVNARRLRLPTPQLALIAIAGAVGLGVALAISAAMGPTTDQRWLVRGVAVAAWGVMYLVQRSADRIHGFHEPYESLWIPGVLATVTGGLLQWLLVASVAGGLA